MFGREPAGAREGPSIEEPKCLDTLLYAVEANDLANRLVTVLLAGAPVVVV